MMGRSERGVRDWGLLSVTVCAACLFSGMGIAIGLLMVAVYGLYAVMCRRWKRCFLPGLIFRRPSGSSSA